MEEQEMKDFDVEKYFGYINNCEAINSETVINDIHYAGYFIFTPRPRALGKFKIYISKDNYELLQKVCQTIEYGSAVKISIKPISKDENYYELCDYKLIKTRIQNVNNDPYLYNRATLVIPEDKYITGVAINIQLNSFRVKSLKEEYKISFDFLCENAYYYPLIQVYVNANNKMLIANCLNNLKEFGLIQTKLVRLNREKIPAYELTDFIFEKIVTSERKRNSYIRKVQKIKDFINKLEN